MSRIYKWTQDQKKETVKRIFKKNLTAAGILNLMLLHINWLQIARATRSESLIWPLKGLSDKNNSHWVIIQIMSVNSCIWANSETAISKGSYAYYAAIHMSYIHCNNNHTLCNIHLWHPQKQQPIWDWPMKASGID